MNNFINYIKNNDIENIIESYSILEKVYKDTLQSIIYTFASDEVKKIFNIKEVNFNKSVYELFNFFDKKSKVDELLDYDVEFYENEFIKVPFNTIKNHIKFGKALLRFNKEYYVLLSNNEFYIREGNIFTKK